MGRNRPVEYRCVLAQITASERLICRRPFSGHGHETSGPEQGEYGDRQINPSVAEQVLTLGKRPIPIARLQEYLNGAKAHFPILRMRELPDRRKTASVPNQEQLI